MGICKSSAITLAAVLCFVAVELQFEKSQLKHVMYKSQSNDNDYILLPSTSYQQPSTFHEGKQTIENDPKFYMLPFPEVTTWLAGNFSSQASRYYEKALNEEQAEVWLHRTLMSHPDRTEDPNEADIVIVCAYLHLNKYLSDEHASEEQLLPMGKEEWGRYVFPLLKAHSSSFDSWNPRILKDRIIAGKVHTIAVPTWNPTVSGQIGIQHMSTILESFPVPTMALGFERNDKWSRVPTDRIVPIPYVASPSGTRDELLANFDTERRKNFVFYTGDHRKHADAWAGCNRSQLVHKLDDNENMDVKLRSARQRISQAEYNTRMLTSDFCLILCGDTPTSRSLASAVIHGCVPLIIGSRLRGLCQPPCHAGWGWTVAAKTHIPFSNLIEWDFPELDEAKFIEDPMAELTKVFTNETQKDSVRERMKQWQLAWVYGWGNPLTSSDFGSAVDYAWGSLVMEVFG